MSEKFETKVKVFADPEALSRDIAGWMLDLAIAKDGHFAVCLSGGSTPKRLYAHLAEPGLREKFPWSRTHWFWGDERFVPQDDALSNYRMTREALLSVAPIPAANIHAILTGAASPDIAAAAYERELKAFYGAKRFDPERPLFDVTFLGLGTDGHTASLFPGTPVLDERERWAAAVIGVKAEPRITLTYPALESSRRVAFLITGAEKREILRRLRHGDRTLPAGRLSPQGETVLFVDEAAAGDGIA